MKSEQRKRKKRDPEDPGAENFEKLKRDLAAGTVGRGYLFYGEESYLREHCLGQLRDLLVPGAFADFNHHRLDGRDVTVQDIADAMEAMPMLAERTLVEVTDFDLFKLGEDARKKLISLLNDLPPHCCVVFVYDVLEYRPNQNMEELMKAIADNLQVVEFCPASEEKLVRWIVQHFQEYGKEIDRPTAEYLILLCGCLMAGLLQEIGKIASYGKGTTITKEDIDAVADPVLSAETFKMADAVTQGQANQAAAILGDLLKMDVDPGLILGALGREVRKLYTARLAIDEGKGQEWLMDLWGLRYPSIARALMATARRTTTAWCADAVCQCQVLDQRLKSGRGADAAEELKMLLVRLEAGR